MGVRTVPVTIDDVMEIACAICHYPYKAHTQDELDEICEGCPLEDAIRRYKEEKCFDAEP